MKMIKLNDKEILIVNVQGIFYAISNTCIHKGGNLSEGSLEGTIFTCPIHGSKFEVTTGKCVHRPRNFFSQAKKDDAVSYELRLKGDDILLHKKSPWSVS
jgi:nitrite reductase/ring-hydroxylating ferredoxin subunit